LRGQKPSTPHHNSQSETNMPIYEEVTPHDGLTARAPIGALGPNDNKKPIKRSKGPTDPDHRAAWIACREPDETWGNLCPPRDLRAKLDEALRSGWSPKALKAYAYVCFRYTKPMRNHVTRAAWRMAVVFAADPGGIGRSFLEDFNADPDRYAAFVK
jgi:hypothetical protein